jgi:hypothetical protein
VTLTPQIFERGEFFYFVAPVAPFEPGATDEIAFADELRKTAPNQHLGWLRGQYVEADKPNLNGQYWSQGEIEVASLTPVLMPVTVMHDPRTAVGMIADARLLTREKDGVPRGRIDTTLGIWKHRFGDVWEETLSNYQAGTLMQSQECRPSYYDCGDCGQRFPKLPGGAERDNWCEHLRGETSAEGRPPVRRLGNVTFTGTGLIYGTRGTKGALDTAHLDVFQDEVAEFHESAKLDRVHKPRPPRRPGRMEIDDKRYEELVAAESREKALAARVPDLEEKAGKAEDLQKTVDKLEIDKKAAEDRAADEQSKREKLEEQSRATTLASERTGKLGSAFLAKLPESIRTRLDEQAKKLSDEDWSSRLEELSELTGVKTDAKAEGEGGSGGSGSGSGASDEELAAAGSGGSGSGSGGSTSHASSEARRRSIVGSILS